MKHQKHIKLTRKANNLIAPNEIAILGAKCSIISDLVFGIAEFLADKYKIAYIDTSHSEKEVQPNYDTFTFNKVGLLSIEKKDTFNKFNERIRYNSYDLSFINGNHFSGEKQIVILDNEKENSIIKRLDQINDVLFFIKKNKDSYIFDALKNKFADYNKIPIFELSEIKRISKKIDTIYNSQKPKLNGLVLVGGKSSRMGKDKSKLSYHGKEHSLYLAELLKEKGLETYLSVKDAKEFDFPQIKDRFLDLGPFGAICSAFLHNPNKAYFVLATDLPFIDNKLINLIIKNRDTTKNATTVKGKSKQFPEPLITIWEPKAYPILLNYLSQGISCPRKVLINSDVKIIEVEDQFITNVNTPEEFKEIKNSL